MKKYWYTYLALSLTLLCSCVESDVLIDIPAETTTREVPIGFSGSYVDHALTRHSSKLSTHLSTMGVWGWRTGMRDNATLTFDDQKVTYNPDSARWEYAPLQYWREGCQYRFCAYAPHQSETDAVVSIDSATQRISISNVSLHGHNLQHIPTDSTKELFRDTPDTDWMIARAGQHAVGAAGMDVEFMMQHILAKLNVRIKADTALVNSPRLAQLTADSIVVGALPAQGDFVQQLTHTPILNDPDEAAIEEWTAYDSTLYIRGTHAGAITARHTYVIEALVVPQTITARPTVTLYYTYHFANGCQEQCRYRMPLSDAFSRFAPGHSYTLTFTISPKRILFDTGVSNWEENL